MQLRIKKFLDYWIGAPLVVLLFFPVRGLGLLLRRSHDLPKAKSVAVLKLLGGGSLINALPFLYGIKKSGRRLIAVCSPSVVPFAQLLQIFDEVLVIDDGSLRKLVVSSLSVMWRLRSRAEATVDLEIHSRLSTLFTTLAMARSRIGLVDHQSLWRRRLYTHSVFYNPMANITIVYDCLLALFETRLPSAQNIYEHWSRQVLQESDGSKAGIEPRIAVGLGCSELGPERKLPPRVAIDLLHSLRANYPHLTIELLGAQADWHYCQSIADACGSQRIENHCGKHSLQGSLLRLAKSRLFIGIDSALMHFARWSRVPTVGIWGPTRPENRLRDNNLPELHLSLRTSCSPCVHFVEPPPCAGNNICMQHSDATSRIHEWVRKTNLDLQNKVCTQPPSYSLVESGVPLKSMSTEGQALAFYPDSQLRILQLQEEGSSR